MIFENGGRFETKDKKTESNGNVNSVESEECKSQVLTKF